MSRFLGMFTEWKKQLLPSSRLSGCMEQLGCHWTEFHKIDIWVFLKNLMRKFKYH